jgi:hypothetical protein
MTFGAACGPGAAKAPPFEALALAADTLEAPWTNLPTAAVLGTGRWVVVAGDWDVAAIADFTGKSLTPLGGATQQAFQHPNAVFTVGDTIYLSDWGKRRTTVWTGDGRLIDSIPSPDALRGIAARGRDGAGQLYFEVRPAPGRGGIGNRDSAAIVRAPRDLSRFDTVARLAPVDGREMERGDVTRFERQVFSGDDLWGVWRTKPSGWRRASRSSTACGPFRCWTGAATCSGSCGWWAMLGSLPSAPMRCCSGSNSSGASV